MDRSVTWSRFKTVFVESRVARLGKRYPGEEEGGQVSRFNRPVFVFGPVTDCTQHTSYVSIDSVRVVSIPLHLRRYSRQTIVRGNCAALFYLRPCLIDHCSAPLGSPTYSRYAPLETTTTTISPSPHWQSHGRFSRCEVGPADNNRSFLRHVIMQINIR